MMDRGEDDGLVRLADFIRLMAVLAFLGITRRDHLAERRQEADRQSERLQDRNFAAGCADDLGDGRHALRERGHHPAIRAAGARLHRDLGRARSSRPAASLVILLIPIVGQLMMRMQTRYIIAIGFTHHGLRLCVFEEARRPTSTSTR